MPIVMDVIALHYESLTHFTPTTAQRKTLAKSGIAMPDGSFYIRNQSELNDAIRAVGRATPNAGESDTARRNSVRRHIIKRANALDLSNMIPDTWNSDGSLKQSAILVEEVEEFLQHFGRRGMKWGEHRFGRDEGGGEGGYSKHPAGKDAKGSSGDSSKASEKHKALTEQAKQHDQVSAENAKLSLKYQSEAADLEKRGLQSTAFKRVYGDDGTKLGEWQFYGKYRQSKSEALGETYTNLRRASNMHARIANSHSKRAVKLRAKAEKVQHSEIDLDETDDFIAHFGRKGMKWGEHIFGDRNSGTQSKPSRADKKFEKAATSSSTAQKLHTTALIRLQQEDLPKLNNNPRYREHSLLSDPARQREYDNKIEAAYLRHLSEVASEQRSASGKKTYSIETKPLPDGTHEWKVHVKDVSHADKSFTVRPVRDPKTGLITDIKFVSDAMTQSALSEEFIAHFGRKGMKWGEHIFGRDRGGSSTVHPDAARASVSLATAKKHGTSALSTHDLRDLNNRLQQERQFSQLTAQRKSEGRKFVEQELRQQGHQALAVYGPKLAVKGAAWVATHIARVGFG